MYSHLIEQPVEYCYENSPEHQFLKKEIFQKILGEEGYVDPNHLNNVELDTILYVKEIIDIDGNQNDIRLQLELWTYWTDPGLALTNESV